MYIIPSREHTSSFGSGFDCFLNDSRFFQPRWERHQVQARWRKLVVRVAASALAVFVLWVAAESIKALRLF